MRGTKKIVFLIGGENGKQKFWWCAKIDMAKLINLVGEKFGYLTVIDIERRENNKIYWKCQCDCGNISIVQGRKLRDGITKSCGCKRTELLRTRKTVHGCNGERLYTIWKGMHQRCNNANNPGFCNYGGRCITICEEWQTDYLSFRKWAFNNGYQPDLTIERKNVNGPYSPDNCTWITLKEQATNRRTSHYIVVKGEKMTITQASKKYGVPRHTISQRIKRLGWDEESAALIIPNRGRDEW